jgi:hypothetical protein
MDPSLFVGLVAHTVRAVIAITRLIAGGDSQTREKLEVSTSPWPSKRRHMVGAGI